MRGDLDDERGRSKQSTPQHREEARVKMTTCWFPCSFLVSRVWPVAAGCMQRRQNSPAAAAQHSQQLQHRRGVQCPPLLSVDLQLLIGFLLAAAGTLKRLLGARLQ